MFFSNSRARNLSLALLCTSSALALCSTAHAQDAGTTETVVVTGSRVIADAANSPTPLTIVTTTQLQTASPTSLSVGLSSLPEFTGSGSGRTQSHANVNGGGSTLNLRGFGTQRTLVLFDGHRAAPSNNDGTVDIEGLPQMLMQRVDVVTGGASAVYGSDAITGVVNFVLDKHFTGVKLDMNAGISTYEDGASYNVGFAAGSDLFGGRGHIEGDVRAFHQDGVHLFARPVNNMNWELTGAGTAPNPLVNTPYTTLTGTAPGGFIICTCAASGMAFTSTNTVTPFNHGTPTGTPGITSGGEYATGYNLDNFIPLTQNEESFARLSYNLNNNITVYAQGAVTQNYSRGVYVPWYINTGNAASKYYANNPFLTPASQALLSSGNPSGIFQSIEFMNGHLGIDSPQMTITWENDENGTLGADGTVFGKYDWSVYYTHGDSRLKIADPHNPNRQHMWAQNDAVAGPNGTIQCRVSTTSYAYLYPGCVPIDPFGPDALSANAYNYANGYSYFIQESRMDNVGGSISGQVIDDWAGPVNAALSMEGRWNSLGIVSNGTGLVNCTGLRLCDTTSAIWQGSVVSPMPTVSMNVWEVAGEVNVPLLKSLPLVQELSADFAGRYTSYSTTGAVETWKIGLDYHVNDEIRFRATNSVDIRAPTLFDLYAPQSTSNGGFNDIHTNLSGLVPQITGGNPNLMPEIARTYTGGVVFTPEFVPNLTFSVDYYHIGMKNAISAITSTLPSVQAACENSGGTSPFCSLYVRPFPFADHSAANFITSDYIVKLNSAFQRTEGWDVELNYAFELGDVWAEAPGAINLRMVANITPLLESQAYPGGPVNLSAVPTAGTGSSAISSKGRVTSFVTYTLGAWSFNLQDRWLSGYPNARSIGEIFVQSDKRVNSVNYQNLTIDKKFNIDDQTVDGYLSIQNVGNVLPPVNIDTSNIASGEQYEGCTSCLNTYDPVGRYFTLGVRATF